jgi:hypothetical protein
MVSEDVPRAYPLVLITAQYYTSKQTRRAVLAKAARELGSNA